MADKDTVAVDKEYIVVKNIVHNKDEGVVAWKSGDKIKLSDKKAIARLLASGHIKEK
jgi:hypothetical protein